MITRTVVRSGGGGGGGPSIPANITAMQGQVIGPPLGEIEIVAGDCLYLNVERLAIGAGAVTGPLEIDANGNATVSDGTNTAAVTVGDFDAVGDSTVFVIETIAEGAMRIGKLVTDAISVTVQKDDGSIHEVQVIGTNSTDKVYVRGLQ